ncbi:hypothetical protein [Burkholderia sp. BCC1977]|uniref:hypothetical protein n=1 Tax=Burkholderia sp. BCC1977 TaxID=2817440 RepID=UPI002ABE3905|nr:hypothetical protein [Burkholderia sp. BCC1977]
MTNETRGLAPRACLDGGTRGRCRAVGGRAVFQHELRGDGEALARQFARSSGVACDHGLDDVLGFDALPLFGLGIAPSVAGYVATHFGIQYLMQLGMGALVLGSFVALALKKPRRRGSHG